MVGTTISTHLGEHQLLVSTPEIHFADFCEQCDEKYASTCGMYRLERIQHIGERFSTCGDYLQGVARIRCTNPQLRTRLLPTLFL